MTTDAEREESQTVRGLRDVVARLEAEYGKDSGPARFARGALRDAQRQRREAEA